MGDSWCEKVAKENPVGYNRARVTEEASYGIWQLMQEQGVTRSELAKRIGKRRSFVTKVLSGDHNFTIRTLADMYWALGGVLHFELGTDLMEMALPGQEKRT